MVDMVDTILLERTLGSGSRIDSGHRQLLVSLPGHDHRQLFLSLPGLAKFRSFVCVEIRLCYTISEYGEF